MHHRSWTQHASVPPSSRSVGSSIVWSDWIRSEGQRLRDGIGADLDKEAHGSSDNSIESDSKVEDKGRVECLGDLTKRPARSSRLNWHRSFAWTSFSVTVGARARSGVSSR